MDDIEERSLAEEGKLSTLSNSTITKTQTIVLHEDVLDAANYPEIRLNILLTELNGENALFTIYLNFKGNQIPLGLSGTLARDGNHLTIEDGFELDHRQLGIRPFTTLGGGTSSS